MMKPLKANPIAIALIIVLLILIASHCTSSLASELSVRAYQNQRITNTDSLSVGRWLGYQISYQIDNSPIYFFGTKESAEVSHYEPALALSLTGAGVGIKHKATKNISIYGQVGYYSVKNNFGFQLGDSEALRYLLNGYYSTPTGDGYKTFDAYQVQTKDTMATTLGIQLKYPMGKHWAINLFTEYRLMKIYYRVDGYEYWGDGSLHCDRCWTYVQNQDFSSFNSGVSIGYSW